MDVSRLGRYERLAVYGSIALIVCGVIGYSYGLTALGMLAAVAMLAVVFLPQLAPGVDLPGSRGSLMVAVGGLGGIAMLLALLQAAGGVLFINTNLRDLLFLGAVAGGALMARAGWQAFQAEGGRFQLGYSRPDSAATPASRRAEGEPWRDADPTDAGERAAEDDRPTA